MAAVTSRQARDGPRDLRWLLPAQLPGLALGDDRRGVDDLHVVHVRNRPCTERGHRLPQRAHEVLGPVGDVRRSVEDLVERPDGPHPDPCPARQDRRRRGHAPVRALAGRLGGTCQRRAEHHDVRAGRDGLRDVAAALHAAVRDDGNIPAGLGDVGVACRGHVRDRGDLRDPDPQHLACRARARRDPRPRRSRPRPAP